MQAIVTMLEQMPDGQPVRKSEWLLDAATTETIRKALGEPNFHSEVSRTGIIDLAQVGEGPQH